MITAVTPPMKRERGFLNTRQETDSGDRRAASPTVARNRCETGRRVQAASAL
jgi:hypothetical protein